MSGVRAERIKTKFERNVRALELRPGVGRGTAVTTVRLTGGLACEIEEGPWRLASDLSEKSGGDNSAPNPGIIGRAALGTCLATSYALWAAKMGVEFDLLEVEVQADYDTRGMYGVDDVPPGYIQIRYVVTVESEASESEIMRVLDQADACCDYLAVFRDPQDVRREVKILDRSAKAE
ncbi:MAG: OsmC family protein [Gemmatimonadetes bacterium]|uniref:OsmC family protein n=1 Tax=Candidatus Kutchimonas denitrificans TaxID=3056748 RepID=A0AAE5CD40_9BACT|nr:OsmC family protein [Gemmatimonadota bacterium]NIR75059.1 OsmC family protein [Candidatus Kutchimonas denitrificans]NIS02879.1 OsmC family protein [Gemmatimonadota bacterium]NIT68588.1 OsmC family protein [Gemmatimonadota bacterium]NIU52848.1 hypothetical protein [Gemmatimonadota bacterium]